MAAGPLSKGTLFPFLFRDDRVRRDFRISFAGEFGDDAEDAEQGVRRAVHRVTERWWRRALVAVLSLIAACSLFPGDYFGN